MAKNLCYGPNLHSIFVFENKLYARAKNFGLYILENQKFKYIKEIGYDMNPYTFMDDDGNVYNYGNEYSFEKNGNQLPLKINKYSGFKFFIYF